MNLSIITAAIPSLHRFLGELQTNRLGAQIHDTQYELSQGSANRSKGRWKPSFKSNKGTAGESKLRSQIHENGHMASENVNSNQESEHRFRPDLLGQSQVNVEHNAMDIRNETGSRTSDGSEKMIIRQTVGWNVHYDDDDNHRDKDTYGYSNGRNHAL
jgi:hypothetical protein